MAAKNERLQFGGLFDQVITASATWNPASIADGDEAATDVTVAGAALGDFVLVSAGVDVADLVLAAQVTAANTVTLSLANNTGAGVDLASATYYIVVLKRNSSLF